MFMHRNVFVYVLGLSLLVWLLEGPVSVVIGSESQKAYAFTFLESDQE